MVSFGVLFNDPGYRLTESLPISQQPQPSWLCLKKSVKPKETLRSGTHHFVGSGQLGLRISCVEVVHENGVPKKNRRVYHVIWWLFGGIPLWNRPIWYFCWPIAVPFRPSTTPFSSGLTLARPRSCWENWDQLEVGEQGWCGKDWGSSQPTGTVKSCYCANRDRGIHAVAAVYIVNEGESNMLLFDIEITPLCVILLDLSSFNRDRNGPSSDPVGANIYIYILYICWVTQKDMSKKRGRLKTSIIAFTHSTTTYPWTFKWFWRVLWKAGTHQKHPPPSRCEGS